MSGTSYLSENGTILEDNLAQLTEFMAGEGSAALGFDFKTFSNEEKHREDLADLYYAAMSQDPLAAVRELYGDSDDLADKKEQSRLQFIALLSGGDIVGIRNTLAKMTDTLAMLKTHNISLDTDKARIAFEDLMDFEELDFVSTGDGKKLVAPVLTQNVQNERDRVQTLLLDNCETFQSKEAYNRDSAAFFGGMKDEDFKNTRPNALKTLDRLPTRTNLARLYMMAEGGFTMEDIAEQSEEMTKHKREWGDKFCKMVLGGDAEIIGQSWAKMMKYLSDAKIPEIDLTNDENIATHFAQVSLLSGMSTDVIQSIGHNVFTKPTGEKYKDIRNSICANLTPDEQKEYDNFHDGVQGLGQCMIVKMQEITSKFYSGANNERYKDFDLKLGCVDEVALAASVLTAENVTEKLNQTIMDAAGKGYSALRDVSMSFSVAYATSAPQSKDKEIQDGIAQRYRDPGAAKTPFKLDKNELSFDDFLKESGIRKVDTAIENIERAAVGKGRVPGK
ncbi:MAG: hypothetical protein FWH17_02505 [Oscillospiraceae bacterium]|nr:hypothetical protein [Oscillospiraceae bacterium]